MDNPILISTAAYDGYDLATAFQEISRAGVDLVEIAFIEGYTDPFTEDYFNDAWGYREFTRPYYGVPLYDGMYSGDRLTAYRWHLPDPIPFKESLRVEIEHRGNVIDDTAVFPAGELGSFFERPDWVSSVAFST